jgi:3-oxoacyl-[acyl-carrier-protein] synthase II
VLPRLQHEHAVARGAEPICEVRGYGQTGDAHHLTEPDPSGRSQIAAIRMALRSGGLEPEEIDYVNAHGTSTVAGDAVEVGAVRAALGEATAARVAISSTKSMHGHAMGAAGGIEGALTALAIRDGVVPPTINLEHLDPGCEGIDHVTGDARRTPVRAAFSSSFGFGGHNAVIAMSEVRP